MGRVARRGRDGAAGEHRGCIDYDVIHFATFKRALMKHRQRRSVGVYTGTSAAETMSLYNI